VCGLGLGECVPLMPGPVLLGGVWFRVRRVCTFEARPSLAWWCVG